MLNNLENIIKENAQKYYENGTQTLSDSAFDTLVDKLREENPDSEVLKTGWGYEVNENNKIKHKYGHIGSLDKVHNWNELQNKFNNYTTFDVSAKLDGLSAVLYYKEGKLDLALTRGDGEYGIDITDKIKFIMNTDSIDDKEFTGAVRGEIMMLPEDFKKYKEIHPEAKNHRNSAAGLINLKEIVDDYKYLTFVAYSVVGDEDSDTYCYNEVYNINIWLFENFSVVAPREIVRLTENNYKEILTAVKEAWEKDFYIDGVVISSQMLRATQNKEIVYNQAAYKFEDEKAVTKIVDIEWNMSKNGAYIPVAIVEPVELEGTTVKRASCYNAKYILDNNIKIGTTVIICKSNQIIPKILEVIKE